MERSRKIIKRFRSAVEKVTDVLVEKAVIEGEEVVRITGRLPRLCFDYVNAVPVTSDSG